MAKQTSSLLIVLAFLALISLGLPDAVLGVAWPSIRHTFGLSLSALGELLATLMAGYLVSSAVSGTVVRRLGVGRVLFYSSVLIVLSLAGYALAPAWWVMVAVGTLAGLGAGAVDAGLNAYAAAELPPRLVTWLHACYGIGATLGPATMTAVLSAERPWRWGYAIIGGVLALMAILFLATQNLWTLHHGESAEISADAAPGKASEPGRPSASGETRAPSAPSAPSATSATSATTEASAMDATAIQTLRQPLAWAQIALFFLYTGLEVTAGQWLFSLLTESRGVDEALAGTCVSL
jgi:MFS family permease